MMCFDRYVKEAMKECNFDSNSTLNANEVAKLIEKSLENMIYSQDFIQHIDEELGFKLP